MPLKQKLHVYSQCWFNLSWYRDASDQWFWLLDGKIKPQIIFLSLLRICVKSIWLWCDGLSSKPIAIDRFNASVTRAMDLHLLKQDTKEEDGEHIFIKVI
jgi:hypothetical protein